MNTTPRDPADSDPLRDIDLPPTDALLREALQAMARLNADQSETPESPR